MDGEGGGAGAKEGEGGELAEQEREREAEWERKMGRPSRTVVEAERGRETLEERVAGGVPLVEMRPRAVGGRWSAVVAVAVM